ncbi:hypothetical protein [Nocardia beijingensis]|uniref:hypothetical protein n=1 Tax=Nocardia beijingensis TaxID=95162 RepID=UPI0012F51F50|nr:hypothetical protein [Nocardia beijingensis]
MTETHVAVYCDVCGECYAENSPDAKLYIDADGICVVFDSIAQAVDHINARSGPLGWFYDGDRVLCDACRAIERADAEINDLYSKD